MQTSSNLSELVRHAQAHGWFDALKHVIRPIPGIGEELFRQATHEPNSDLAFLLDLRPGQCVLELGCGFGDFSIGLARQHVHLLVADHDHQRAMFTEIRCHQSDLASVETIELIANNELPLPRNVLDVVLLHARYRGPGADPSPTGMLREIQRVLKGGGQLFLSFDHPRSRGHESRDHAAFQLTLSQCRDLLQRIGVQEQDAYVLMPDACRLQRIVPLHTPYPAGLSAGNHLLGGRFKAVAASLLPARLLATRMNAYALIARKP